MHRLLRSALALVALAFAAAPALAELRTQSITYQHDGVELEGFLVWDASKATAQAPQPGVVVCHEWWGNSQYAHERAKKLAELGYVAFALDLYGKGKLTGDAKQAQAWSGELYGNVELLRGRAKAGYDVLAKQPQVDATRIAAIGYCMGGTVALELARAGAPLRAIVPFHASKLSSLGTADDNARITATITVCHGGDDAFVSTEELAKFVAEMKAAKLDYQFLSYAGAVHSFTNRDADKYGIPGVAYDAKADARSWEHMKLALAEAFVQVSKR
ncbi:MAG: dienelactone hydrolase family protein [Planctomycetes bacterium]|nr:dienelactone hydrolase family protein [Planctomycetota bacterium]